MVSTKALRESAIAHGLPRYRQYASGDGWFIQYITYEGMADPQAKVGMADIHHVTRGFRGTAPGLKEARGFIDQNRTRPDAYFSADQSGASPRAVLAIPILEPIFVW